METTPQRRTLKIAFPPLKNSERALIIKSLIKDDLVHTKLLYGMKDLDIHADSYYLSIGETIHHLLGYDSQELEQSHLDIILERYYKQTKEIAEIKTTFDKDKINELVLNIYQKLILQLRKDKKTGLIKPRKKKHFNHV